MNKPSKVRDLLKRLQKTLGMMATRELAKYGLTVPQLIVLKHIMANPMTIGQVSKAVELSYSTVSGIIDRLEREELVVRTRDEKDRRVVWISKTDKLVELFAEVDLFIGDFYNRHFQGFSDDELDNLIHSLETFLEKIEEIES
jgi:MarR family transcriptional regulator, organic hydroperoxide resistance regulator